MLQSKPVATNAIEIETVNHGVPEKIIYVQTPYPKMRNMVFKGGGTRGVGYAGAAAILEKYKFLDDVENVAGSSAGAIAAMFVALGFDSITMIRNMSEMDLGKFIGDAQVETLLDKVKKVLSILWRDNHSLSTGDELLSWLQTGVDEKLSQMDKKFAEVDGKPYVKVDHRDATFADLAEYIKKAKEKNIPCNLKHLYIVVTVLSAQEPESEVCSHANPLTLNVPIAKAVRASCSFPFIFKTVPLQFNQREELTQCTDGGCINNFPIGIFDDEDELPDGIGFTKKGTNPGTFGIRMDSKNEREHILYNIKKHVSLDSVTDYFKQYFYALTQALNIPKLRIRNILSIDHEGLSALSYNFDKMKLIESAKKSTLNYLRDRIDAVYTAVPYKNIEDWLGHQSDTELDYIQIAYEEMLKKEKRGWIASELVSLQEVKMECQENQKSIPQSQISKIVELAERVQLLKDYKDYVSRKRRDPSVKCEIRFPEKHINIKPDFFSSKWSVLVKEDAERRLNEIPKLIEISKAKSKKHADDMMMQACANQSDLINYVCHLEKIKAMEYEMADLQQQLAIKPAQDNQRNFCMQDDQRRKFELFARELNPIINNASIQPPLNVVLDEYELLDPVYRYPVERGKVGFTIGLDLRLPLDRKTFLIAALLYFKYRNYKPASYEKLTEIYHTLFSDEELANEKVPVPGGNELFDIKSLSKTLNQKGLDLEVSVYKIGMLVRYFEKREFPKYKPVIDIDEMLNIPRIQEKESVTLKNLGFFKNNPDVYVLKKTDNVNFIDKLAGFVRWIGFSLFHISSPVTLFTETIKKRDEFMAKLDNYERLLGAENKKLINALKEEVMHAREQAHKKNEYKTFLEYIAAKKIPVELVSQVDRKVELLFQV